VFYDSDELQGFYAGMGWVVGAAALVCAALSPTYLAQSFEVRKRGVRHKHWLGNRELFWDEIDQVDMRKLTVLTGPHRGRRSSYAITFHADRPIHLRRGFLACVNAFALIQGLKMHGDGVPVGTDDEPLDAADDRPARRQRKRRREEPSGETGVFQEARQKLAAGESADDVEAWLCAQGVPPAAAAGMIDKALSSKVRREFDAAEKPEVVREARAQLMAGKNPEKVKRWLREQGCGQNMAAAIVADLRQELL
jgi:hypothetical protein